MNATVSTPRPAPFAIPKARDLFGYRPHWAHKLGPAPFLPMTRAEMEALGWDACDVVLVTGDAYVDHPSFGMALVGRLLEAHGFRVGILSQPDWHSAEPFAALGRPKLFFGVTGGNMDSMVNRYTSDRKVRSNDAYTAGGEPGKRPDRCVLVYANRCREAFPGVPIVVGGIEASLRRVAHYDYWSDKVRRSVLIDSQADLLVFGNAERAVVELAHRLASGAPISAVRDIRGTAFTVAALPEGFTEIDSSRVDTPGRVDPKIDPYLDTSKPKASGATPCEEAKEGLPASGQLVPLRFGTARLDRDRTVLRLPSFEAVVADPVLYAHASRVVHLEANPGNARALVQRHGNVDVWLNPPPVPLTTPEMDRVYELPYQRRPHPAYGDAKIPAYEMIRFSVTINRGCFGGCTFCSITEHEGRIIQSRSEESIVREIEKVRDTVPGFTGVISDIGGPTANMYRLACKSREIEAACRKPSCVYPGVCENLNTNHKPLVELYRKVRKISGIKRVFIASGIRYDLAVKSPEYIRELAQHHVGGYLKIAPEHTEEGPLSKMMKPGIGTYYRFKELFDKYSKEAGKEQYLIPYFIAAHPGTTDEDMLSLALWLKKNGFRADQVQAFLPSPMATATAMYHTRKNPLRKVTKDSEEVSTPKDARTRKLHKAFLRYHDANNWPIIREALIRMGREDLIGSRKDQLVPWYQPLGTGDPNKNAGPKTKTASRARKPAQPFRTTHTGLTNAASVPAAPASEAPKARPTAPRRRPTPAGPAAGTRGPRGRNSR
jgi:uncharacterized radical SAM protein YgiQ